jgi:hypothetical protein
LNSKKFLDKVEFYLDINTNKIMNKYANQYLDTLKEKLLASRPFNQSEAFANAPIGAGVGAAAGSAIGALSGLAKDPGYDAEGRKKSRIKESLKGLIGGGLVGAGAGALGTMAIPTIGQGAVDIAKDLELAAMDSQNTSSNSAIRYIQDLFNRGRAEIGAATLKSVLPYATVDKMINVAKQINDDSK